MFLERLNVLKKQQNSNLQSSNENTVVMVFKDSTHSPNLVKSNSKGRISSKTSEIFSIGPVSITKECVRKMSSPTSPILLFRSREGSLQCSPIPKRRGKTLPKIGKLVEVELSPRSKYIHLCMQGGINPRQALLGKVTRNSINIQNQVCLRFVRILYPPI